MARPSKFGKPGYIMRSFACDQDTQDILKSNVKHYGDVSSTIRGLILAGSSSEAQRKVLEQEQAIRTLQAERDEALARAEVLEAAINELKSSQGQPSIDWSKYSPDMAERLKAKYAALHPEVNI